jgi:ankyrin repeat protein
MKDNMKIARLLVEYGANVNAESERSGTVLQTAYRYKCLNVDGMVDFLLEHGARQDKP